MTRRLSGVWRFGSRDRAVTRISMHGMAALCLVCFAAMAAEPPARDAAAADVPHETGGLDDASKRRLGEAKAHAAAGRWEQAELLLRKVWQRHEGHGYTQFALGTALIELDRHREALQLLEPLVERYPSNPSLHNNIAWSLVKTTDKSVRDPKRALRFVQDALRFSPNSPVVWSTSAEVYFANGRFRRAADMADIAIALAKNTGGINLVEYAELQERCTRAARAMELIE